MQNKVAVSLIACILVAALLFEVLHPAGFLFPYFARQEEVTPTHKKRKTPPIISPPPFTGLAPQKVAESGTEFATCDTYQRKVFYNETFFYVIFAENVRAEPPPPYGRRMYSYSPEGEVWTTPVALSSVSMRERMLGCLPDIAFRIGSSTILDGGYVSTGDKMSYFYVTIADDGSLTHTAVRDLSAGGAHGVTICQNLDTGIYIAYVRLAFDSGYVYVIEEANNKASNVLFGDYSSTTGGTQLLAYESSSPYTMLLLAKQADDTLQYSMVTPSYGSAPSIGTFSDIGVTLTSGFESFCACSEVQEESDSEIIHLVYIKSTGELCYRRFLNDAWESEKTLITSGASYPVIASGKNGPYVFYVKNEKIWLIKYDGTNWLGPFEFFTDEHTYNNPAYLSTNQNVQNEKICLVWTEGTESPYEVWFSYVND